jgi:hypothetical protein
MVGCRKYGDKALRILDLRHYCQMEVSGKLLAMPHCSWGKELLLSTV